MKFDRLCQELDPVVNEPDQQQHEGKDDSDQQRHKIKVKYDGDEDNASTKLVSLIHKACSTLLTRKGLGQPENVIGVSEYHCSQTTRSVHEDQERDITKETVRCFEVSCRKVRMD